MPGGRQREHRGVQVDTLSGRGGVKQRVLGERYLADKRLRSQSHCQPFLGKHALFQQRQGINGINAGCDRAAYSARDSDGLDGGALGHRDGAFEAVHGRGVPELPAHRGEQAGLGRHLLALRVTDCAVQ